MIYLCIKSTPSCPEFFKTQTASSHEIMDRITHLITSQEGKNQLVGFG